MSAQGWFYDGTSSVRHEVTLTLLPDCMEIRGIENQTGPLSWPLD
ncbi:MAG: DUF7092 domain-containing protein [Alphaproteobacteria bacterium]